MGDNESDDVNSDADINKNSDVHFSANCFESEFSKVKTTVLAQTQEYLTGQLSVLASGLGEQLANVCTQMRNDQDTKLAQLHTQITSVMLKSSQLADMNGS